jgi:cation diffusion facilitator family transporter
MKEDSHAATGPLIAALFGNLAIAILKLVAAVVTGSSAMLAESAHSAADTTNQVLLFVGLRRARRPADELHPFGHGKEVYFWAFLVAIGIFAGGSAFSLYEGILHLVEPAPPEGSRLWAYAVLLGSIAFEGVSFTVAIRAFVRGSGPAGYRAAIREARDPTLFAVVLEDTAAMIGLFIALAGVGLTDLTGNPVFDASASVLIGLVLAWIAFVMAREVHSLLLGESAHPDVRGAVGEALAKSPEVRVVTEFRTLQMGPDAVYVMVEAVLDAGSYGGDAAKAAEAVEERIRAASPPVRKVYLESQIERHSR